MTRLSTYGTRRLHKWRLTRDAERLLKAANTDYRPSVHLVGYPAAPQTARTGAIRNRSAWLPTLALFGAFLAGYAAGGDSRDAHAGTSAPTQPAFVCTADAPALDEALNFEGADHAD